MPTTAKQHFDNDITRAKALQNYSEPNEPHNIMVIKDLYRAAVTFAVGALDAYLCDAYVDCLTAALRTCKEDKTRKLPPEYAKELLPAGPLIAHSYEIRINWAFRMAARLRMEKYNLLQISRIKDMVNPVLPPGQKLWVEIAEQYIALDVKRLTGITQREYSGKDTKNKQKAREKAAGAILRRIGNIIQRRHDIVHNCDRPKVAVQQITRQETKAMITDVETFVRILDRHLDNHRVF